MLPFFSLLSFLTFIMMWVRISGRRSGSPMPLGYSGGEGAGGGRSEAPALPWVPAPLAAHALQQRS